MALDYITGAGAQMRQASAGSTGLFARAEDSFAHGLDERVLVRSFLGAIDHWLIVIRALAGRPSGP